MSTIGDDRPGCLTYILRLFGGGISRQEELALYRVQEELAPYRLRDDFLSQSEISFYRVLKSVVGETAAICPKVRLADLFFLARPDENLAHFNRINAKHIDFLLCEPKTMKPLMGIELDDSSHSRDSRKQRDAFVDQTFETAGLPLLRYPVLGGYNPI